MTLDLVVTPSVIENLQKSVSLIVFEHLHQTAEKLKTVVWVFFLCSCVVKCNETFVSLFPSAPEVLDYEPISTATDMW